MKFAKIFISLYGWLILAIVFLFLAGGDRPLEIAVWLSPLFLLRFFQEIRLWKGIVFSLPLLLAITLISDRGMLPIPFRFVLLLTAINSVIALLPYVVAKLLHRSLPKNLKTLLFPMAVVAAEAFVASGSTGGTWGNPAYGISSLWLLQLASITGIWGIMFLVYWTASVINEIWENRHQLAELRTLITIYLCVMAVIYGFGQWRLHHEKPPGKTVRVAGITAGPQYREEMIGTFGKIYAARRKGVFDAESLRTWMEKKYQALLSESNKIAKSGVEIVAWSEGATFIFKSDEQTYLQKAIESARKHKYYLGMGLIVLDDNCQNLLAKNQPFIENKLVFIAPEGTISWEYSKSNLAPGYEKAMTVRGDSILKSSITTKGTVTGVICYDMDFPNYIRQTGMMRADLLLAPSNDWLEIKNTHAKMARFRAVENGCSLLRPSSSGLSTAVDPFGRIVSQVDDFESNGIPMVAVLRMGSISTLYAILGDFVAWICAFGALILIVFTLFRKRSKTS